MYEYALWHNVLYKSEIPPFRFLYKVLSVCVFFCLGYFLHLILYSHMFILFLVSIFFYLYMYAYTFVRNVQFINIQYNNTILV